MKIKRILYSVLITVCLLLTFIGLAACGGTDIKSISVDTGEADLVFEVGTEFNANNIKVIAKQGNGNSVRIATEDYAVSEVDVSTTGEKTVTVTYKEFTATYKINVVVLEVAATFSGDITCGTGAGNTVTFPADFKCYNTLKWEIWYKANPQTTNTYKMHESGKYKISNGVYSIIMSLSTETTTSDSTGVWFRFTSPSMPYQETTFSTSRGPFTGILTLVTE